MKTRDKINLINRAIAALETPSDLSAEDLYYLLEDMDTLVEEYLKEEANEIQHQ